MSCTVSLDLGADYDRCNAVLVFSIGSGEVDGVDVSGVTVLAVADTPKVMMDGDWRLGLLMSDTASDEQAEKLGAVFGGQLGGPMEALGPLVSENLGMERVPIEVTHDDGSHRVRIGDSDEIEVEEIVPFGKEDGQAARLSGILHPAVDDFAIAKASSSRLSAFGMDFASVGKSGFAAPFSWSA